jgi:hypothetical protein
MVEEAEKEKMIIKLNKEKKIFISCAVISMVILCAFSLFLSFKENNESAQASPAPVKNISVKEVGDNCSVGGKYSVSWSSDCRGGNVMVWLSDASSSKSGIDILVPLTNFSASDFGATGADARSFFTDIWKINLSSTANKGKFTWTVPNNLYLSGLSFNNGAGIYYIYALPDGRTVVQKMVKDQAQMPVMATTYYLRVDIQGKNGCVATGYSQPFRIVDKN